MTHGGIRAGQGRKRTAIDDKRVLKLRAEGWSTQAIADRFGVSRDVIRYAIKFPKATA